MTFISPDDFKYYTREKYHLRLSEFSEAGSQTVITNVAVSLYSYVQDMDRLIQDALEDNTRTHQESRLHCPVGSGYRCNGSITFRELFLITLLSSSPYRTGFPPSGKVGLGGGESVKQLNTSVMFLKKKAKT